MAVRVKQQQYVPVQPVTFPQSSPQPNKNKRKKSNRRLEKTLYIAFVVVVTTFAILILNMQASIQTISIEIQGVEEKTNEITKENVDLAVSVKDLSRYDRIWEKAKALGLTQDSKNVKVVPGE